VQSSHGNSLISDADQVFAQDNSRLIGEIRPASSIFCFLILAGILLVRFFRTGGPEMQRVMNHPGEHAPAGASHACHHEHHPIQK